MALLAAKGGVRILRDASGSDERRCRHEEMDRTVDAADPRRRTRAPGVGDG